MRNETGNHSASDGLRGGGAAEGAGVPLRLALTCHRLDVLGGRERDCLEIARELSALGHHVTLLTTAPPPASPLVQSQKTYDLTVLARRGLSNHAAAKAFARDVQEWRQDHEVDAVIGFNRMAGLDFLYAVDRPWPQHKGLRAMLPRNRGYWQLERAVYGADQPTYVFFLAERQSQQYVRRYALAPERHEVLAPILRSDRTAPEEFYHSRAEVRAELNIPQDHALLINVAIYGYQKGTDRAVEALASAQNTTLVSVGLKDGGRIEALAERYGVAGRVRIIGYCEELDRLIGAADLMVHPAREETTGSVIIESLLYGIPVISTDICGYSQHVRISGAGCVLDEPFRTDDLGEALRTCLEPSTLAAMRLKAQDYSAHISRSFGMTENAKSIARRIASRLAESGHRAGS